MAGARMNGELLSRPRVERALADVVLRTPLTLLHAPLGAGKTAAASMAFAHTPGTVWMDARPWHRDAFIRDVVEAVRRERPDFGRMTIGALESGASPAHMGAIFAQELTHVDAPLLLIVDNVHVFTGELGFGRFVDAIMHALPPNVHILAMGRALPNVAGKLRLVDGGELLRFDADEIRSFGTSVGRALDDRSIAQIVESTEGWAAGVMLAVTAPHTLARASNPHNAAESYLTTELFSRLDRDARTFLEDMSVFETFEAPRKRIDDLRRVGTPLTETLTGRYKLHPVLREVARKRLRQRGGERDAHRVAATVYGERGNVAAALFHAGESGDAETATTFLRVHAAAAIATGDRKGVQSLAALIESDGPGASVRFYVDALLEKGRGSVHARVGFARAVDAADRSNDDAISFAARAQTIEHDIGHLIPVDPEMLLELSRRADALGGSAVASALVLKGWSRAVEHDFLGALATIEPLAGSSDPTVRFNSDVLRAYAETAYGDLDAAQDTLDGLMRLLENDEDRVVPQTLALVWFTRLALVWGRTTAAADAAAQAERLASALDLRAEEAALYVALTEIASHTGDIENTVRYAERARARAEHAWYAGDVERVRAFAEIALARAAFLGHDNAIAKDLAERVAANERFPSVQRTVALTEAAFYALFVDANGAASAIVAAREAIAAAKPVDASDAVALATADDLLAFLDAANGATHDGSVSGSEAFAALIQHRRGLVGLEHAGIAIGKARQGASEGTVAFEAALDSLTREGPRFEARLVRAYASAFIKPRASAAAVPDFDLTPRELEILALLVDGLTNKEIAQRLVLSTRTVETHVERVLGKLEVGSRSRAIAKAIRMGLVTL